MTLISFKDSIYEANVDKELHFLRMAILSIKYDYYTPLSKTSYDKIERKYNTFDFKHIHLEEKTTIYVIISLNQYLSFRLYSTHQFSFISVNWIKSM